MNVEKMRRQLERNQDSYARAVATQPLPGASVALRSLAENMAALRGDTAAEWTAAVSRRP